MRRTRKVTTLTGSTGIARVGRRFDDLVARIHPGDIALVDQDELDDAQLTALVEAGAGAAVLIGHLGDDEFDRLEDEADGTTVRVHGGVVHVAGARGTVEVLASGHPVDLESARAAAIPPPAPKPAPQPVPKPEPTPAPKRERPAGPAPKASVLDILTLRTELSGRPVVVVDAADHAELLAIRRFVHDATPALVAVGAAADDLIGNSWAPDVIVVAAGDPAAMPSHDALHVATDVVLLVTRRTGGAAEEADLERLEVTPHVVETTASAQQVALRLAQQHAGGVVVTVGVAEPEGPVPVVAAETVRALTGTGGSSRALAVVLVVGLLALLLAVAATPVGHDWLSSLGDTLGGLL